MTRSGGGVSIGTRVRMITVAGRMGDLSLVQARRGESGVLGGLRKCGAARLTPFRMELNSYRDATPIME
jgi:hypothetical protein